jgi:hypothetical protein
MRKGNTICNKGKQYMKTIENKSGEEHLILDSKGEIEYVLVPLKKYEKIIDLLEDYGLGQAMKEAETSKILHKKAALEFLKHA